jgi:hypothetical protein
MTELRALSLGELLDRTFSYYRQHFWLFVGIMALPQVLGVALTLVSHVLKPAPLLVSRSADPTAALKQLGPALGGSLIYLAAVITIGSLIYTIALGATTQALSEVHLGRAASIREAYRSLSGKIWRLFASLFLFLLIAVGVNLLVFAAAFLLAMLAAVAATIAKSVALTFGAIALAVLVAFAGAVLAIIFLLRYAVTVPALVLENLSARQALKRSAFLTRGYRGQIFLIGILMYLITLVVTVLFQGPFLAAGLLLGFKFGMMPTWLALPYAVAAGVGGALAGPFLMIALALAYYDTRVRKEGFDLQLMMASLEPTFRGATAAPLIPPAGP